MPAVIAFAGVLGGLAVVRWAYKTALRVNQELDEARRARVAESAGPGEMPVSSRMPGLVPGIHVFLSSWQPSGGWPG